MPLLSQNMGLYGQTPEQLHWARTAPKAPPLHSGISRTSLCTCGSRVYCLSSCTCNGLDRGDGSQLLSAPCRHFPVRGTRQCSQGAMGGCHKYEVQPEACTLGKAYVRNDQ